MAIVILILMSVFVTYGSGVSEEDSSDERIQLVQVTPSNKAQVEALRDIYIKGDYDFLAGIMEKTLIYVSTEQMNGFVKKMSDLNMSTVVLIKDYEKMVSDHRSAGLELEKRNKGKLVGHWDMYHSYEEIQNFIKELAKAHPEIASVQVIGKSTENRTMLVLKVSTGGTGKKGIWCDANMSAREWMSIPVLTYIANELVTNSEKQHDLLSRYDFYLLPSVNPDGYEYSRQKNRRMQKKTRSNQGCKKKFSYRNQNGVDPDSNWGYKWGGPGANRNPCSTTYLGPHVFSEPETTAIRDFITKTKANWIYLVSLRGTGPQIVLPFADGFRPSDYNEIEAKAIIFNTSMIAAGGPSYIVQNYADRYSVQSGISTDWAKAVAKIKYTMQVDVTNGGNDVPMERIKTTVEQCWAGLNAMWLS